jgi:hypothetical protein
VPRSYELRARQTSDAPPFVADNRRLLTPQKLQQRAVEFLGFLDVRHVTAVLENNDLGQQPPISAPALGLQRLKPAASLNVHAMALLTSLGFLHRKLLV